MATHKESAPASITWEEFDRLMPPIATIGEEINFLAEINVFIPAGLVSIFVLGGYIDPIAM